MTNSIHCFKPGRHLPMGGTRPIEFTERDLRDAAACYDPALHRAPLVIGHPTRLDPAYGHVKALSYGPDGLEAIPEAVEPAFAELVNKQAFPNVSVGWYAPDHPRNPVPGKWYVREVSFLGAVPPAVRGLRRPTLNPAFATDEDGIVRFGSELDDSVNAGLWRRFREWLLVKFGTEDADQVVPTADLQFLESAAQEEAREEAGDPETAPQPNFSQSTQEDNAVDSTQAAALMAENERLKAELAAARQRESLAAEARRRDEAVQFAQELTRPDGNGRVRLAPKHKNLLVELLMLAGKASDEGGLPQFAGEDGSTRPLVDAVKALFAEGGAVVQFGEFATADRARQAPSKNPLVADAERRAETLRR
jgi:hypothetical protein